MDMNKKEVMSMMNCSIADGFKIPVGNSSSNWSTDTTGGYIDYSASTLTGGSIHTSGNVLYTAQNSITGWDFFQNHYYPLVIKESYPVYLQEKAQDKGKQAFEILKVLQDKKLLNVEKVSDFIDAMDCVIKTL